MKYSLYCIVPSSLIKCQKYGKSSNGEIQLNWLRGSKISFDTWFSNLANLLYRLRLVPSGTSNLLAVESNLLSLSYVTLIKNWKTLKIKFCQLYRWQSK